MPRSARRFFDITEAQWKPEIQPDGVLDYGTWKAMAGIGDLLHPGMLPHQPR